MVIQYRNAQTKGNEYESKKLAMGKKEIIKFGYGSVNDPLNSGYVAN